METLLLTKSDLKQILTMKSSLSIVEKAFQAKSSSETSEKAWLYYREQEGDLALWSAYIKDTGAAGLKAIGYNPNNSRKGLPTITAVIILNDPETSFPIAILDGTTVTSYRTGAAGGVAAKYLAREDSKNVGVIGSGIQGRYQVRALSEVFDLEEIKVYDQLSVSRETYADEMAEVLGISIEAVDSPKKAVNETDIIVTATPSREPIVMQDWIQQGVHINAIGADEPGKEEIDPRILTTAKIVVDDYKETMRRGEVNVPLVKGIIKKEDIHAELEEIVTGKKEGRVSGDEITLFDAAGLAIEDVAVAWYAYKRAEKEGIGNFVDLIGVGS